MTADREHHAKAWEADGNGDQRFW